MDPVRERAAGRRVAGRVVELRPRAEEDVRVAMGAGYARVTQDSRVTRGTAATENPRNEVRARTEAFGVGPGAEPVVPAPLQGGYGRRRRMSCTGVESWTSRNTFLAVS